MRTRLSLQFGLLYLVLWFLFLLGADFLIGTALRESPSEAAPNVRLILWTGGLILFALSAVPVWSPGRPRPHGCGWPPMMGA